MYDLMVAQDLASYATCCWVRGVSDCCGELLAEGGGYFLVSSGLSIVEADRLVGGNSRLFFRSSLR